MIGAVLILGAGRGYVDTIRAAGRASERVVVTDADEEAPGQAAADDFEPIDITDVQGTVAVAEEYGVDAVVPVNDFGVRTAATVADHLGLPGVDPEVAVTCTNKARMRDAWAVAEVPQPAYRVTESWGEAREVIDDWPSPLVVKPASSIGGGSRGVRIVDGPADGREAYQFAQAAYDDDRVLVEECIEGTEHTVEAIVVDGTPTVLAISDRELLPPPYRVDKAQVYPSTSEQRDRLRDRSVEAIEALDIDLGAVHLEASVTDDGIKLIELGARGGGGAIMEPIVRAVSGVDYVPEVVRLHAGEPPESIQPSRADGVTYRYLTPTGGRIAGVHGMDTVSGWDGVTDCQLWVSVGDELPDEIRVGSDRSGAIVTHLVNRDDAYELARRGENTITFDCEHD